VCCRTRPRIGSGGRIGERPTHAGDDLADEPLLARGQDRLARMLQAADRCCRSDRFDPGEIVGRNHHALVLLRQEESFLARVVDGVVSIDPADNIQQRTLARGRLYEGKQSSKVTARCRDQEICQRPRGAANAVKPTSGLLRCAPPLRVTAPLSVARGAGRDEGSPGKISTGCAGVEHKGLA
jgi:hypothetical protein